jgi:two-component system, response regulator
MEYSNYTILLIDDDLDDAEMTMYSLRKISGLDFLHIDDGVEASRYLLDERNPEPTLILLDLKMPKVDGIQILRKLKSNPEKKHIPVIALISSKDGKHYLESFGIKADSYLIKPVDCKCFLMSLTDIGLSKIGSVQALDQGFTQLT